MTERQAPLTLSEAAAYLNVTERYVRRLVAERRVAYHKVGRLLRFRRRTSTLSSRPAELKYRRSIRCSSGAEHENI